jgi:hypothetical protein
MKTIPRLSCALCVLIVGIKNLEAARSAANNIYG